MRKILLLSLFILSAYGQWISQPGGAIARGTSLPAKCSVGDLFFKTDATAGQNIYECASTDTWTQQLNSGAGGASTALDNLASVNINSALLFQTGLDAGSTAKPMRNPFFYGGGTYGTTSIKLDGTPTAARVWTFQDATDTVVGRGTTDTMSNKTFVAPVLGVATATSIATGTSPPSVTAGTGGVDAYAEGTAPAAGCPAAGVDCIYADSTQHALMISNNNGTAVPIPLGTSVEISGANVVGPQATLDFRPGTGLSGYTAVVSGSTIQVTQALDTSYVNTNYVKNAVVANAGTTGTTVNTLTKLTGAPSTALIAATTDTGGVIGVTTAGAGTTGSATIQLGGLVTCQYDATAITAGHYVQISSTTAGNCHDAGATYPTSGQVIGRAMASAAGSSAVSTELFGPEIQAAAGGGSGTVNSGTATHLAYYASSTNAVSDMGADFTFASHTISGGAASALDMSAAPVTTGFRVPIAAGAAPVVDGFLASNTTNHTLAWGSNGNTFVGAIAATGTGTATTCTNQFVTAVSSLAVPTCTTATLAGAQFANQGTTTTLLHGNAAGNPSFAQASLTADVTGVLPLANGGTNCAAPFPVLPKTATYQVLAADFTCFTTITVASGTFTITLVASGSQPAAGLWLKIINYGSGVVTVARSGQNINGAAADLTLAAGSASAPTGLFVTSDGTNYFAQPVAAGSGSGTVNSGTAGQLAWYASSTTAVSGNANFALNSGGTAVAKWNNISTVGMGVPTLGWQSVLSNSSAVSLVTLATAPTAGDYEIHYGLDLHTACTTGSEALNLTFAWTGNSARVSVTGDWPIGAAQNNAGFFAGVLPIHVSSGNVTFTPTLVGACATGTATWDGNIWMVRVN